MHLSLPSPKAGLSRNERADMLDEHDAYIKSVVGTYFANKNYTLIYITEAAKDEEKPNAQHENSVVDGAETPLVLEQEEE